MVFGIHLEETIVYQKIILLLVTIMAKHMEIIQ